MARGWESKSIEAQQAEATEDSAKTRAPRLTPEQAARRREIEGLQLSRQNLLQQLSSATNLHHRQMIEDAIAELESRIGKVDGKAHAVKSLDQQTIQDKS